VKTEDKLKKEVEALALMNEQHKQGGQLHTQRLFNGKNRHTRRKEAALARKK
jgi:hypothetical protein